jgi:hypothetical protein
MFCNPPIYASVGSVGVPKHVLNIYPNPASGTINIAMPAGKHEEILLFDGIGRTMNSDFKRIGDRIEIITENLANGLYHIHYTRDGMPYSGSFIKE